MRVFVIILFLFFSFSKAFALEIRSLVLVFTKSKKVITSVYLKKVPFQLLDACLKSGDSPIKFQYDFKIYRHRFLLPDVLKFEKQVIVKVRYDKEKNLYVVNLGRWKWNFYKPEKALLKACKIDSLYLPYFLNGKDEYYLKVEAIIQFKCHLTEELDYREGLNSYEFSAETSSSL
ncbi:MAG: DUF4390 domain-containing protein [Thermodesulfobacteria bacterium]|nr:DUF4390 domain-containing protein [Thermodesulfobacteriota bacterium]